VYKPDGPDLEVVPSLADHDLPHDRHGIAPGNYLRSLSRNWYIYRTETD